MKNKRISIVTAILILQLAFLMTETTKAASGDADPTFGNNGSLMYTNPYTSGNIYPSYTLVKMAVQSDNKIVVAGSETVVSSGITHDTYLLLKRLNANGSADTGFGFLGDSLTFKNADIQVSDVAIQANGNILVCGSFGYYHRNDSANSFFVARFFSNGILDTNFGNGSGFVITDFLDSSSANAMAIRSDGRIIVVGATYSVSADSLKFAVARYYSNGTLDTSFSGNGRVVTGWGENRNTANSVVLQPNNKILVGGTARVNGADSFALVQLNADGTLDNGFGTGGKVSTDIGEAGVIYSLALQPDKYTTVNGQKILAVGNIYGDLIALARYNPDGSLDASFGSGGKITTSAGTTPYRKALSKKGFYQADEKIIVVTANIDIGALFFQKTSVTRFTLSGSLDASFGNSGQVVLNYDEGGSIGNIGGGLQSDGKILVNGRDFIERLLP
ncbi:MAG: hypothetical protein ABJA66_15070 [Actinomycetota bacterium]